MSRTDKDRPMPVQQADPANRRFQQVGAPPLNGVEWPWKKLWPASQCWCCSNRYWRREKRKKRSGWREDLRRGML